jgi:hypothetical protein
MLTGFEKRIGCEKDKREKLNKIIVGEEVLLKKEKINKS